jgi:hypothetical protein
MTIRPITNFASNVYHSKLVQSSLEKVGFLTGFVKMRASQYLFGKKELALPASVQNNVVQGTHQGLNNLIGLATSKTINTVVAPVIDIADPIAKGFSQDKTEEKELVTKHSLPKEILEDRFTDFRNFILNSRIHLPAHYYKHAIVYDPNAQDIMVLVNGQYVGSKAIIRNFKLENRIPAERMFLPPILVHKMTGERYCYLEKGLTRHDVEHDIRPYKILPAGKRPLQPIVQFKFRIDAKLESPEDAANFLYHAWFEMIQPSGACYSFGVYGKGVAQCPDPTVYADPSGIRTISFRVKPGKALEVFEAIQDIREKMLWNYHFTQANCASFVTELGKVIDIDISEKDAIKLYDSLLMRIKIYAISSILAEQLREPDVISKIGSVQELANVTDIVDRLPGLLKALLTNFSLEDSMKSAPIANLLQGHPYLKSALVQLFSLIQKIAEHSPLDRVSDLSPLGLPISAEELRDFTRSLLTGSTTELTYKINNLIERIVANYYEYKVHSPGFLYDHVRSENERLKRGPIPTLI